MLLDNLKIVVEKNKDKNILFLRNLLKEQLQFYLLDFIYNSKYAENFLFKGGTCLRFCFDLPRLSEDLDFDVKNFQNFNFNEFASNVKNYFNHKIKYQELEIKISGKNKLIYLKFPILEKINFPIDKNRPSENTLFLRIDLSLIEGKCYQEEITLKSTYDFSFLIKRYSLSDIFAGKLTAILQRKTFNGENLKARFKGRDFFDIIWLAERKVVPNFNYLQSIIKISSKKDILKLFQEKFFEAKKRKEEIKNDLFPFIEDFNFLNNFIKNFDLLLDNLYFYLSKQ